jgi:TolA-binding protein
MTSRALLTILFCVAVPLSSLADATEDFNFAQGQLAFDDYFGAVDAFTEFLESHPDDERIATAYYRIGECQFRLEDYEATITAETAALEKFPDAPEAARGSHYLGRSHMELKNFEAAHQAFAVAAKGKGEVRELSMVLDGECLCEIKNYAAAAKLCGEFLEAFEDSQHRPGIFYLYGWTLNELQRYAEAVEVFKDFIQAYPDHELVSKARLSGFDALMALGQTDDADRWLKPVVAANPDGEEAMIRLIWSLFKRDDPEKAATKSIEFANKYPHSKQYAAVLYNAAIAIYKLKKFEGAIRIFRRVQADRPDCQEAQDLQFWLAMSLFETKQFDEAKTLIDALLENGGLENEKVSSLIYTMAEALVAQDQLEKALPWFTRLIESYPESKYAEHALYSRALAQQRTNDFEGAVASISELLEKYPTTKLRSHAHFAIGEYLYRLEQYKRALPYLQELSDDGNPKVIYRLGWTLFELGQYQASIEQFTHLTNADNEFRSEALYMCGRCHENLEQPTDAIPFYEQLVALEQKDKHVDKAFQRLAFLYDGDNLTTLINNYRSEFPDGEFGDIMLLKAAEVSFSEGQIDDAISKYQALADKELTEEMRESVIYGLAWCYKKQSKLPQADVAFAKVESGDFSKSPVQDAVLQRGEIAYEQERYDESRTFFSRLVDLESNRGERACYMMGWCHRRLDDIDGSAPHFKAVIDRFPISEFFTDSAIRLGEALHRQGNQAKAREILQSAVEGADPTLAEELMHLYCTVLIDISDWQPLIDVCQQMEIKYPKSQKAYLVPFRLGLAYKGAGVYDKAIEQFKKTKGMTDTIEAAYSLFNIGTIHYSQGAFKKAGNAFLRVETLYDYGDLSPKSLYHAIDAFIKAGDNNVARAETYMKKMRTSYSDTAWRQKAEALFAKPEITNP